MGGGSIELYEPMPGEAGAPKSNGGGATRLWGTGYMSGGC